MVASSDVLISIEVLLLLRSVFVSIVQAVLGTVYQPLVARSRSHALRIASIRSALPTQNPLPYSHVAWTRCASISNILTAAWVFALCRCHTGFTRTGTIQGEQASHKDRTSADNDHSSHLPDHAQWAPWAIAVLCRACITAYYLLSKIKRCKQTVKDVCLSVCVCLAFHSSMIM